MACAGTTARRPIRGGRAGARGTSAAFRGRSTPCPTRGFSRDTRAVSAITVVFVTSTGVKGGGTDAGAGSRTRRKGGPLLGSTYRVLVTGAGLASSTGFGPTTITLTVWRTTLPTVGTGPGEGRRGTPIHAGGAAASASITTRGTPGATAATGVYTRINTSLDVSA